MSLDTTPPFSVFKYLCVTLWVGTSDNPWQTIPLSSGLLFLFFLVFYSLLFLLCPTTTSPFSVFKFFGVSLWMGTSYDSWHTEWWTRLSLNDSPLSRVFWSRLFFSFLFGFGHFLSCQGNAGSIMVWVIGAVSLNYRIHPYLVVVSPVDMVDMAAQYMSWFCHQLV